MTHDTSTLNREWPLTPAEEIARFSMIWMTMIGSTVVVRKKGHINVTYFANKLPLVTRKPVQLLGYALQVAFFLVVLVQGSDLASSAMSQMGAATGVPMGLIMVSIPISGAISILYLTEHFIQSLFEPPKPETEATVEEPLL